MHLDPAQQLGQDVVAKVVGGVGVFGVLDELGQQDVGVEEVDAHGGIHKVGVEGRADLGGLGFFDKSGDFAGARDLDDAEAGDLVGRDGQGGNGDVGAGVLVLLQHAAVVHLVDLVAGEDEDMARLLGADGIDVLVDRVGGALVPGLGDALHGGKNLNELAQLAGHHRAPALADVPVERERLVLREDVNVAQVGVDAVGQCDVDDAVLAGEGDRGLGAIAREGKKPFASATCKQHTECVSHRPTPGKRSEPLPTTISERNHRTPSASGANRESTTRVFLLCRGRAHRRPGARSRPGAWDRKQFPWARRGGADGADRVQCGRNG